MKEVKCLAIFRVVTQFYSFLVILKLAVVECVLLLTLAQRDSIDKGTNNKGVQ